MKSKIAITILCAIVLASTASAAEVLRPMVGFLPFHGSRDAFRYAVPYVIYWQICHIPGVGRTDMDPMVSCIELDGLTVPKRLDDCAGYSKLAVANGVDYLVTGRIEKKNGSRLRFAVAVYSAKKPSFHKEHVYECKANGLVGASIAAAKDIAGAIGVAIGSDTAFETDEISVKAIDMLDRSIELGTGCERDNSEVGESCRIAWQTSAMYPRDQMLIQWARSYYVEAPKDLEGYRELRKRSLRNFSIRKSGFRQDNAGHRRDSHVWWTFDRSNTPLQLGSNGRPIVFSAWRNNMNSYRFRMQSSMPGQKDVYQLVLQELCDKYPNSAYMQYNASEYLARLGEWNESLAASKAAARMNPRSFRLHMNLVCAYLSSHENAEASQALESALKRWPDRSECHLLAAVLYRRWKQYDHAAEELRTVQRYDPQASGIHELLAHDYMRAGKIVEAVREMARADDTLRKGMVTFSVVLSGIFVFVAMAVGLLAYLALRPERRPRR